MLNSVSVIVNDAVPTNAVLIVGTKSHGKG